MNTWIALFRGINVGGNNLLPMKELTTVLEGIGCAHIKTYIQSGNVVFRKAESKPPQLIRLIEKAVLSSHGFAPKVLLLTVTELEAAVGSNPFPEAAADPKSLHLFFLAEPAKSPDIISLDALRAGNERFLLAGNTFYLHAPDGVGRSRLAARAEKLLGVSGTARNWRTVSKVLDLARSL